MTNLANKSILVIDDDINLCKSIKYGLISEGASVSIATDGRAGILKFEENPADLVLLDIRMPELDGWETGKYLRMISNVPIIMLTSLKSDVEMVKGLNIGADDYITKPFNPQVLLARIEAVLRRLPQQTAHEKAAEKPTEALLNRYVDPYIDIDLDKRQLSIEGEPIKLSTTEFDILTYLVRNANRCVTYNELLENVWGKAFQKESDYVRVYISFLRRKIEKNPRKPVYLQNEYRRGYRFSTQHNST